MFFFNIQKNYYNKGDVFRLFGHYAEILLKYLFGKNQTQCQPPAMVLPTRMNL